MKIMLPFFLLRGGQLALAGAATAALLFVPVLAHAAAGDLDTSNDGSGSIVTITPGRAQSTFASGLNDPVGLAFGTQGNLFEADNGTASILKFSPSGAESSFASGLNRPVGLAFDAQGNLYEVDLGSNSILKFSATGAESTFASGLSQPYYLAFGPLVVPEPSTWVLVAGASLLFCVAVRHRLAA